MHTTQLASTGDMQAVDPEYILSLIGCTALALLAVHDDITLLQV